MPARPGCATQGNTFEELLQNLYEAIEGCLSIVPDELELAEGDQVMEITILQKMAGLPDEAFESVSEYAAYY